MDNDNDTTTAIECFDYNELLAHFYSLRDSIEWSSLLSVRILFGLIYLVILVGGLVGNGGVIGVLVFAQHRLSARNILLLNLMCADLLLCFTAVPITPVVIIWKRWFLGSLMCRCLPLAQSASVMIISWTLAAIAIDKYIHIKNLTKPPVRILHAVLFVVASWLLAGILNLPFALSYKLMSGWEASGPESPPFCGEFCVEDWWQVARFQKIYGTLVLLVQFVAPMLVISYCYGRILHIVQKGLLVSHRRYSCMLNRIQQLKACRLQRKATYILVSMVLAFLLAWAPLTLLNIIKDYGTVPAFVNEQVYFWGLITHWTAMSSVLWNPMLCFWLTCQGKVKSTKTSSRQPSLPLNPCSNVAQNSTSLLKAETDRQPHNDEQSSLILRHDSFLNGSDTSPSVVKYRTAL